MSTEAGASPACVLPSSLPAAPEINLITKTDGGKKREVGVFLYDQFCLLTKFVRISSIFSQPRL